MNFKFVAPRGAAILLAFLSARSTMASFIVETTPSGWTRPTSGTQAASSQTTYQEWDTFSSAAGPNTPTTSVNPNGTGNVFDSTSATDGAFLVGTDIYSFSASIAPQVVVPEYASSSNPLNVLAQVQSYGGDIDTADLSVTYSDAGGSHTVLASTLPNYSYTQLYIASSDVGFGEADQVDHAWTFTVPDTSTLQLNFGWDAVSSALQSVAVDTQSTVPEPGSLSLLAGAGLLLTRRRQR